MYNCTNFEQCQSNDIVDPGECRDGHQFTQIGIVQLGQLTNLFLY